MEDPTLLGGTWLCSDVMLLTSPPTLVSVLDCKKVYQKSVSKTHIKHFIVYYIKIYTQHVTRRLPRIGKKGGRCATITEHSPRDEEKEGICSTKLHDLLAAYGHPGSAGTNPI